MPADGPPSRPTVTVSAAKRFIVRLACDIAPKKIDWLWKPFIMRRAINMMTGDPGIGKSTVMCDIVAALSTGRLLPGEEDQPSAVKREPMRCWMLNAEDNAEDVIVWRLRQQGADMRMVHVTDKREVVDGNAAKWMSRYIADQGIGFVTLDPMQSWTGTGVDLHRANETRDWSDLLRVIAVEQNVAFLIARHKRKASGKPGTSSIFDGLGTIDITGNCRSEVGVMKGKDGVTFVARIKGNIGKVGQAFAYRIDPPPEKDNEVGILSWTGPYDAGENNPGKTTVVPKMLAKCREWLHDYLRDGSKPAIQAFEDVTQAGFTEATVKRARKGVVTAFKQPGIGWVWALDPEYVAGTGPNVQVCTSDDEDE